MAEYTCTPAPLAARLLSVEDLEALPARSVVRDRAGWPFMRLAGAGWVAPGDSVPHQARDLAASGVTLAWDPAPQEAEEAWDADLIPSPTWVPAACLRSGDLVTWVCPDDEYAYDGGLARVVADLHDRVWLCPASDADPVPVSHLDQARFLLVARHEEATR
ncbi:hypothetical protein D5R93_05805 [Actinomyces lilanjuaniae]|uniref:Uncharacterized protein n=1 Tax=Actinomyces lilanjuaniae TaxID=2321394 RepID=A0ABN5PMY4_9ACTO|nr:hypothetical protein [Actinomyces lilanjuaniae]AYD89686.1 hypothetical protein D5R93_05805 [Actinomyces lilanjuaniae]